MNNIQDDKALLLQAAIDYVQETGRGTIGALQRRFNIGFNQAVNLRDELTKLGMGGNSLESEAGDVLNEISPPIVKIILLDGIAQSHLMAFSRLGVECLCFTENMSEEQLQADLLFLVGNFDFESTQQAVNFCRKSTNKLVMAIQLGEKHELWADCCLRLSQTQTAVEVISEIVDMFSDAALIAIDMGDLRCTCAGVRCRFISSQAQGEDRVALCEQTLLEQFPMEGEIYGGLVMMKGEDITLDESYRIMDFIHQQCEDDSILIFGITSAEQENNQLSISAIVSYQ